MLHLMSFLFKTFSHNESYPAPISSWFILSDIVLRLRPSMIGTSGMMIRRSEDNWTIIQFHGVPPFIPRCHLKFLISGILRKI
ncbi:hypothetical protein OUZ56_001196 [Daphnia magna]|uniref:Uncharacterized protein n=2 Tax=Daphnia magna TaxID=35525 RepID=A0ABR0A1Y9_9CRUS|nr:hypothetical protein OUZ56_001196 [Daphnia magna]